jgi:jasmonate ZIM domain-containing protein
MFLAGNGSTTASKMAQPRAQAQVPISIQAGGGDGVLVNQRTNTPTGSGLSSAVSVSSHPVGQCGNGTTNNHELMGVKPTGASNSQIIKASPQKVVASLGPLAPTTMAPSAIPQARQASLARFLEKRKERVMNAAPYLAKKSPECSTP